MPWVEPTYETVLNENGEEVVREVCNYLTYGNFISAVINFFILAFVVFFIVKAMNRLADALSREEEAAPPAPPAPPAPSKEEVLLTEIRDLLAKK